jgi:cytochrome c biogenesis factor
MSEKDIAGSAVEAAVVAGGLKVTQTSAAVSVVSWLLSSEAGMVIGLLIAALSASAQIYFLRKRDQREEREHQRRLATHSSLRGDFSDSGVV